MAFWTTILRCADGHYYTGHTDDLHRRIGRWSRAKKQALITGDWGNLSFYAKPPRDRVSTSLDTNG